MFTGTETTYMKYALVDNIKLEASKGLKGICSSCNSEVIAKCGANKINHWAHKGVRNCDPWLENETDWHRAWKNNFAKDWQEIILNDEQTNEKHIADIRTIHGLVIEFQHSQLDSDERTNRELFYKNMVWIVDGTRLTRDYPRFLKAYGKIKLTNTQGVYLVDFPEECFPSNWIDSKVPVLFDFKGMEKINYASDMRYPLYCLFPKSNVREVFVGIFSRESVINHIISGNFLKQKREPEKQIETPTLNNIPSTQQGQPQYFYDRGRLVKRRRF